MDTKELETRSVDVNGDLFSTPFPVVNDQLLCCAHIEGEVVLAPHCQVSSLSVTRPTTGVVVHLKLGVGVMFYHSRGQGVQEGPQC